MIGWTSCAIRPTIVATSPLYGTLANNAMLSQNVIPKVTSMPYVTLKIPPMKISNSSVRLHLEDSLNMSQWYVEEGNVVPRNQNIIYKFVKRIYETITVDIRGWEWENPPTHRK